MSVDTTKCLLLGGYCTLSIAQVYFRKRVSATVSETVSGLEESVNDPKCIYNHVHTVNTKVYTGSGNNK